MRDWGRKTEKGRGRKSEGEEDRERYTTAEDTSFSFSSAHELVWHTICEVV